MTTNDYTAVEVYAKVFGIKAEHKHLDLFTDARSERGMLRDWRVSELSADTDSDDDFKSSTEEEKLRVAEAEAFADKKMKWREKQRVEEQNDDIWVDTRKLTEDEKWQLRNIYIGIHLGTALKSPQSEDRAKAKNYYKQQVYRLLRKAKANIEAVEKGRLGVGH